ncbi:MAG: 1-(5-phosphoribosyl)-5-[(5-phosphoribosylamino) methylideneamino] imidazole-4-carboxamide isomerase [Herpetosiphonaceae bacterium]|nr:MAG: 1-(5-phosphoribosyl)-5-[(5-phosphoribosylamino) methylideneamino] imidazole-4-carboxamide isomerase [Herpetosiphonaceae bacterium]
MEIIPAIDLQNGRCVRLYQGDFAQATVYGDDPAAVAQRWVELGARRLHVVDLDGARLGRPSNIAAIKAIIRAAGVPIQLGGGLRSRDAVEEALGLGADRVILGTAAVADQELVADLVHTYRAAIIVGIDARDGLVATEGWRETTAVRALDLARRMAALGVERIIYTDISRDGTLSEPNFAATAEMLAAGPAIIASGGIASLEHLQRLALLGVEGAIVGRALYTGAIDLRQALSSIG